jgi:hypothetical protein
MRLGWPDDRREWLASVTKQVSPEARVLCEDGRSADAVSPYALAVSARVPIIYSPPHDGTSWAFTGGRLGGRPVGDWTDDELRRMFERWNVGWVWVQSPQAVERFARIPGTARIATGPAGTVFRLDRTRRFVVKGRAMFTLTCDHEVVLNDVVPDDGEVVVSLRHLSGWSVNPSRIVVEPEIDPYYDHPLLRLRLAGPVSRIVLRRDGR